MKIKTIPTVVVMLLTGAIYAQDTVQIFNDLKSKAAVTPPAATPEPSASTVVPASGVPVIASEADTQANAVAPTQEPAMVMTAGSDSIESAPAVHTNDLETVSISEESSAGGAISKSGLISVNLKEVELSSVIRLFSTLSGANIIVPELEEGAGASKVDVSLTNVEWKSALQSILETQGFELYEKNPGSEVYSVRKKPADTPEPMNVQIFKMNYATVSNVIDMITTMVPAPGKISVFPARNTIVVQSTAENLLEIDKMITAVDLPRQQVFIEAKFMELSDSASEKLGIDWQVLGGYNVGVKNITGSFDLQKMYDMNGKQYQDATYEWVENPNAFIPNPNDDPLTPGDEFIPASDLLATIKTPTVSTTLGATLSAADFNLVLAALKEVGGTKIVSNPKIIVANEETAQIYIGTKEPNIKQQTTQVQNADPITTYNLDPDTPYFEYGIKLSVTPSVNTSSNITVNIAPSLTRFVRNKEIINAGTGNSFPITTEKTIETVFSLASGQTAAIGGLTEARADNVNRKVPLLGSLPLIGRFFSYSEKSDDQTETIIFVTVGLANPENINMETGLPQDSSLAMRYDAKTKADRQIKAEELKVLSQHEAERARETIQKLQIAEQERLLKKEDKKDAASGDVK